KSAVPFLASLLVLTTASAVRAQDDRVQFGQAIVIEAGESAADAICFGCSILVRGRLSGDAVAFGGRIQVEGSVGADVVAFGGSLDINGSVGADAVAVGGSVRLGPNAEVENDVAAVGGRVERDPQAKVGGQVTSGGPMPVSMGGLFGLVVFFFVGAAVINLVLVLLGYLIAGQRRVETLAGTVRERAGLALLAGMGVVVGAVALFITSAFLGWVAAIVAPLVALALFVTLVAGYTGLSAWLGRVVAPTIAPLLAVLLGAVLITLLQFIPLVGFFAFLAFGLLALGSATLSGYGTAADWLPRQFAPRTSGPPASPPAAR
ncbi:MAG: hypothetical protein ACE5HB_10030, partial [Terriglobia bacterium]